MKDLALYMGFGRGPGAALAGLNAGVAVPWFLLEESDSRSPRCEWHISHSNVISHTAWEAHRP